MLNDSPLGPDEDAGLRWLLQKPDPVVCAMLAAGPLPLDAIVGAWRDAAAGSKAAEPSPSDADLRASLKRLAAAGYVAETGGEYALTQSGAELAGQVDTLYRALDGGVSTDTPDGRTDL